MDFKIGVLVILASLAAVATPANMKATVVTKARQTGSKFCAKDDDCAPGEGCHVFAGSGLAKCEKYHCRARPGHGKAALVKYWHPRVLQYCCANGIITNEACRKYSQKPADADFLKRKTAGRNIRVKASGGIVKKKKRTTVTVIETTVTTAHKLTTSVSTTNTNRTKTSVPCKRVVFGSLSFWLSGWLLLSPVKILPDNGLQLQTIVERLFKQSLACAHVSVTLNFYKQNIATVHYKLLYPTEEAARETLGLIDSDAFIAKVTRALQDQGGNFCNGVEIIGRHPPTSVEVKNTISDGLDNTPDDTPVDPSSSVLAIVVLSMALAVIIFIFVTIAAALVMWQSRRSAQRQNQPSGSHHRSRRHRKREITITHADSSSADPTEDQTDEDAPVTLHMYDEYAEGEGGEEDMSTLSSNIDV